MNTLPIRTWLALLMAILGLATAFVGGALIYEATDSLLAALIGAVLSGLAGATPLWVAASIISLLAEANEHLRRIEFASRASSPQDTAG